MAEEGGHHELNTEAADIIFFCVVLVRDRNEPPDSERSKLAPCSVAQLTEHGWSKSVCYTFAGDITNVIANIMDRVEARILTTPEVV